VAPLPLPTSSAPGTIPGEGTGRLVNAQALKDGTDVRWVSVPGLIVQASPGVASPRGGLLVGGTLYLAREGSLWALTAGLALSRVDSLDGANPITMSRNNRGSTAESAGPDVVIVSEVGPFVVQGGKVVDYPDTVVGAPNDVSFLDGYFLFTYANGLIRATGTDATPTNTLAMSDQSFTVAESSPDGLMRGTVQGGLFYAWGQSSIEVYADQGLTPFPLSRQQVIPVGLFGPWCVAGFEQGWDGPQIFVAADGTVRRLDGYTPNRISTRAVEHFIAAASGPNVLRACVYTYGGNAIWSLSSPQGTWEFNVSTGEWHERRSTGLNRWRAETSVNAFGRWLVGDIVTGDVLAVRDGARTEAGKPLVSRVESAALRGFPDRIRLGGLTVDIVTGQGDQAGADPVETDPACMLSWSLDGGARWAQPVTRQIGPPGAYGVAVRVGDLGRASREGVRVAVEVSDPVPFSLRAADLPNVTIRKGS
jgi:hypothetical protein